MSGSVTLTSVFTVPPQVAARAVGNETVLLDLAAGTYYGLDPIGARIWSLISTGKSLGQVCETMLDEYEVAREVIEQDALSLLGDLVAKNLVTTA